MSLNHIAFRGVIEARAEALGRETSQQRVEALECVLQSLGRHDVETNALTIEETEGQPVDLFAYLDQVVTSFPVRLAPEPEPVASEYVRFEIGNAVSYRRPDDGLVKITRSLQAAEDAALAKEIKGWANPWRPGRGFNRTRQAIITNKAPALAATMKAEISA